MIMRNKEIVCMWLNAWKKRRERKRGRICTGFFVYNRAQCVRTEAHEFGIELFRSGHVANCAASRFKIASQNQSLAFSKWKQFVDDKDLACINIPKK